MNFSSQYVGTYLKTYRTEVQWRDTTNYAAAIGDHNPQYFDDECKNLLHLLFIELSTAFKSKMKVKTIGYPIIVLKVRK